MLGSKRVESNDGDTKDALTDRRGFNFFPNCTFVESQRDPYPRAIYPNRIFSIDWINIGVHLSITCGMHSTTFAQDSIRCVTSHATSSKSNDKRLTNEIFLRDSARIDSNYVYKLWFPFQMWSLRLKVNMFVAFGDVLPQNILIHQIIIIFRLMEGFHTRISHKQYDFVLNCACVWFWSQLLSDSIVGKHILVKLKLSLSLTI